MISIKSWIQLEIMFLQCRNHARFCLFTVSSKRKKKGKSWQNGHLEGMVLSMKNHGKTKWALKLEQKCEGPSHRKLQSYLASRSSTSRSWRNYTDFNLILGKKKKENFMLTFCYSNWWTPNAAQVDRVVLYGGVCSLEQGIWPSPAVGKGLETSTLLGHPDHLRIPEEVWTGPEENYLFPFPARNVNIPRKINILSWIIQVLAKHFLVVEKWLVFEILSKSPDIWWCLCVYIYVWCF